MNLNQTAISPAHLEQYFGVWAIHEEPFRAAVERVNRMDLTVHMAEQEAKAAERITYNYPIEDGGVAVLKVTGPLMKYTSSLSGGTSTVYMRRLLRAAVQDDRVRAILLRIDSPGGTVAGTQDLADDIAKAAKEKTVFAYIEDMGASAAYWLASQTRRISANSTALVGSIGTFAVVQDLTGMAAQMGIKVHVIRAGKFKGAGEPGTEVTAEQLGEWQRIVDDLNEHFVRGVASGRRMSLAKTRELADGRVHVAAGAESLGLVDAVQSFDEALADIRKAAARSGGPRSEQETVIMEKAQVEIEAKVTGDGAEALREAAASAEKLVAASRETAELKSSVATTAELKAALPDSTADFREQCTEQGFTLAQAQAAWMSHLREENTALKAKAAKPGVEPLGEGRPSKRTMAGGDAVADFNAAVAEKVAGGMARMKAAIAVAREDPTLHEAYLRATNSPSPRVQGLIGERFEMVG
ncbi:MAG TPA: S49 family peptidase [Thermoguttaceae bacterium]|nr:S49 family peptidase [Thermoguttaceae bacterium]